MIRLAVLLALTAGAATAQPVLIPMAVVDTAFVFSAIPDSVDVGPPLGVVRFGRPSVRAHESAWLVDVRAENARLYLIVGAFPEVSIALRVDVSNTAPEQVDRDRINARLLAAINVARLSGALPTTVQFADPYRGEIFGTEEAQRWLSHIDAPALVTRPSALTTMLRDSVRGWQPANPIPPSWSVASWPGGTRVSASRCYVPVAATGAFPTFRYAALQPAPPGQFCGTIWTPADGEAPLCAEVTAGTVWTPGGELPLDSLVWRDGRELDPICESSRGCGEWRRRTGLGTVAVSGPASQRDRMRALFDALGLDVPEADLVETASEAYTDGARVRVPVQHVERPADVSVIVPPGFVWTQERAFGMLQSDIVFGDAGHVALAAAYQVEDAPGIVVSVGNGLWPTDVLGTNERLAERLGGYDSREGAVRVTRRGRVVRIPGAVAAAETEFAYVTDSGEARWGRLVSLVRGDSDLIVVTVVAPPERRAEASRVLDGVVASLEIRDL